MADAVTSTKIADGHRNAIYHFTNSSDGTGENNVVKVDVSALSAGPDGQTCTGVNVERIVYSLKGRDVNAPRALQIEWVGTTTDSLMMVLPANGEGDHDYKCFGGLTPTATGVTGDISFSFPAATLGSYAVTMEMKKKYG
jgi:hypothetical protein